MNILIVGAGDFIGTILRYLIGMIPVKETTLFPVKIFFINILGCIIISLIATLATINISINQKWILFAKVDFCGGFTTFSTFALETSELIKNGYT